MTSSAKSTAVSGFVVLAICGRQKNARMAPERTARRQRLGLGNIETGCRQHTAVKRRDDIGFDQMPAPPDIEQPRATGQTFEQICVEDAARL